MDFEAIFDALPGVYLILAPDESFTMLAANEARLEATMTTREETIGHPLFDLFPDNPDDPSADGVRNLTASLKRVIAAKAADTMAVQKYDIPIPESEGGGFELRYWSPMNIPILDKDGEVQYIIHRVEDVTEFVLLQERNTANEREILARSAELHAVNEQLRKSDEMKTSFVAMVSHELRTPLVAIRGFTEIMSLRWDAIADSEKLRYVGIVDQQAQRLAALVSSVLSLSRIEAGALEPNPELVDITELLNETLMELGIDDVHVRVSDGKQPCHAFADPGHIRQIIINYITNAKKYGGRSITVVVEPGDDWLDLRVCDDGAGVAPKVRDQLFKPFAQISQREKDDTGSGLGLSIASSLASVNGGSVWYEDLKPHGSCFGVKFHTRVRSTLAVT